MASPKSNTNQPRKSIRLPHPYALFTLIVGLGTGIIITLALLLFERSYVGRVYPRVTVGGVPFGGSTPTHVHEYWQEKNIPFSTLTFEFTAGEYIATLSGQQLALGYDPELSAQQAYLVGRSGHFFSDIYTKFFADPTNLDPYFRWDTALLQNTLETLASYTDVPARDALFTYENGKVTAFRPSVEGKALDISGAINTFTHMLPSMLAAGPNEKISIPMDIVALKPNVTTEQVNDLGIKERIGYGYSEFSGSIPGRIHNVALAAARMHGVLVPPGKTLSFNEAIGEISASTGYQAAYIIQNGRTVLGDGGGVCQVSTTLFRAALNAGLPITERRGHAYRVHYYEDGGFKAGLDATVFSPSVDLKITNDTPGYILVQTKTDTDNLTLEFELYGTSDGRKAEIVDHQVWGVTPPPPPLYQDDPTLPEGTVRQVDWAAWGAQTSFRYIVTRGDETLQDEKFTTSFRPWQAVYLKGTKI